MTETAAAALTSWELRPWLMGLLVLTAVLYVRGWRVLRRQMPERFGGPQLAAFLGGLGAIALAAASPLDAFAGLLLQVHMAQHLLLTMVAPPLVWLGRPAIPLLRGLPERWAKSGLGPFLAWPGLRRFLRRAVSPPVAWLAFAVTIVAWHLPGPYQLALRSSGWHEVEHAAFLAAGLLFWWPVVQPWPSEPAWPRWTMIPYLLLADLLNTALSAVFIFSDRIIYPAYAAAPRLFELTPLEDQAAAGALMWVPGSLAFLVPVGVIVVRLLDGSARGSGLGARGGTPSPAPHALSIKTPSPVPRGPSRASRALTAARRARPVIQAIMLVLAAAIVIDGLAGPHMAPMNLAGVLPWTYWRTAAVAALLVAGNAVCFVCPFTLPRALAKRLGGGRRVWPRWLRAKWLGAALILFFLWGYEALAPWDSPRWTAAIVLAYFAAAFAVDALFRGAAFCKYVCPIGQFQFVQSLASPLTVAARDPATCRTCTTHDCLRGNAERPGCGLELFLPEKRGNLDCTFCLDCAAACPHDNVGLAAAAPLRTLASDPRRGALGRLSARPDLCALALLVVFDAFINAAAMVEPVASWLAPAGAAMHGASGTSLLAGAALLLALVAVPAASAAAAAWASRALGGATGSLAAIAGRFAPALIPLGLTMWTAHFAFHLWTGAGALLPVVQRIAVELGSTVLGRPAWAAGAPMAAAGDATALELLLLDAGLVATVVALWRTAVHVRGRTAGAAALALPWMLVAGALWLAGVWIVFQPMAMRGTMMH